jgi:hypothetical protein
MAGADQPLFLWYQFLEFDTAPRRATKAVIVDFSLDGRADLVVCGQSAVGSTSELACTLPF